MLLRFSRNSTPTPDGSILTTSTSAHSADASPVVLKQTDNFRFRFLPKLIDNPNAPDRSVEGKLLFERKGKNDAQFPSEKSVDEQEGRVTRRTVRIGDHLELSLDSSETFELYKGLQQLYQLSADSGGIQPGVTSFVAMDGSYQALLALIHSDPAAARLIACQDNFALIKELLGLISQGIGRDELGAVFENLEQGNLQRLSSGLNLEQLERASNDMRLNMDNSQEEFWQQSIFGKYPWILSQVFDAPCVLLGSKAYVGGKAIDNHNGNVCDFLYEYKSTNNVALLEIKTPCTQMIGSLYREGVFSLTSQMSGAVNQVLNYRDSLMKDYFELHGRSGTKFEAFSPKCVVVIGNSSEIREKNAAATFENFRNNLNGVAVVTFDEVLQKVDDLISILKSGDEDHASVEDLGEDTSPFGEFS